MQMNEVTNFSKPVAGRTTGFEKFPETPNAAMRPGTLE